MTTQYEVLFTSKDNTSLETQARTNDIKIDTDETVCLCVWVGEQQFMCLSTGWLLQRRQHTPYSIRSSFNVTRHYFI